MMQEAVSLIKQHSGENGGGKEYQKAPKLGACVEKRKGRKDEGINTHLNCHMLQDVGPRDEGVVFDVKVLGAKPKHSL